MRASVLSVVALLSATCIPAAPPPPVLPTAPVYCVTADIAGVPVRVMTLRDPGQPDHARNVRADIRNALRQAIVQAEPLARADRAHELARWRAAVAHGISIAGIDQEATRHRVDDPPEVFCVCLTFTRHPNGTTSCAGGCLDCMACTVR